MLGSYKHPAAYGLGALYCYVYVRVSHRTAERTETGKRTWTFRWLWATLTVLGTKLLIRSTECCEGPARSLSFIFMLNCVKGSQGQNRASVPRTELSGDCVHRWVLGNKLGPPPPTQAMQRSKQGHNLLRIPFPIPEKPKRDVTSACLTPFPSNSHPSLSLGSHECPGGSTVMSLLRNVTLTGDFRPRQCLEYFSLISSVHQCDVISVRPQVPG